MALDEKINNALDIAMCDGYIELNKFIEPKGDAINYIVLTINETNIKSVLSNMFSGFLL